MEAADNCPAGKTGAGPCNVTVGARGLKEAVGSATGAAECTLAGDAGL